MDGIRKIDLVGTGINRLILVFFYLPRYDLIRCRKKSKKSGLILIASISAEPISPAFSLKTA